MLYPLKFTPILKERIWGGKELANLYNKGDNSLERVGESWEVSGLESNVSIVSNGFLAGNPLNDLVEVYMGDLVGEHVYNEYGSAFPLLIKLLDANQDLSIQVHPDDKLAAERHDSYGKTEFWYVLDSKPDAKLLSGFSKPTDKETYLKHLQEGTLEEIVKWHSSKRGDVFFIPSGRIHALGKGNVVLEVQQASDVTYRIYDYNRRDVNGELRELHTEQALDAIHFECLTEPKTHFEQQKNMLNNVIECDFFAVNYLKFDKTIVRNYYHLDSFVVYVCLSGQCTIQYSGGEEHLVKGETVLIPAELDEIELLPSGLTEIMEIFINQ